MLSTYFESCKEKLYPKRIVVIGSQGAGKSTLAQVLGDILGIEVIHLDHHFWEAGWKRKPVGTRIAILESLVQKDQWIIEGTYLDFANIHFKAADTIIFLDIPNLICFSRMILRHIKYRGRYRPDLPEGCTDRLTMYHLWKTLTFPYGDRELLLSKIDIIREQEVTTIHILKLKKDIAIFLANMQGQQNAVASSLSVQSISEDREWISTSSTPSYKLIPETVGSFLSAPPHFQEAD